MRHAQSESKEYPAVLACTGVRTFMDLPHVQSPENADYVVAGVPFDTLTTARPGTRLGPEAIREAYVSNTYNPDLKVDFLNTIKGIDYGDIPVFNGNTQKTFESITSYIDQFISAGAVPVILGGDHSIAFPELMGYKKTYGKMALIHFDSHSDTGYHEMPAETPYDHGTPFKDALNNDCIDTEHSIQIGMRGLLPSAETHDFAAKSGMSMIKADEMHNIGIDNVAKKVRETLGDRPVFVSFDIDFLDPSYAPGTGTPEGCGFSTWEALEIMRKALLGLNLKGFDIVCVNPTYDIAGITALSASRIVFEFLSLLSCKKAGVTEYKGFQADF